ncbi:MAG: hypothetical protein JW869_02800 [Candidatus Omnitrophica bacterium]|nr:hypothetical protein [Candidatus Omnitrophota bacterium]
MIEEIKNIKSGIKELRQFGITLAIVTGVLGGLFLFRGKDFFFYFLIFSFSFLCLGLLRPQLLKPVQKAWMTLAVIIGWLVTRLILLVLFYFIVTPIGICARICGQKLLDAKYDKYAASYWLPKGALPADKKVYENQF